MTGGWRGRKSIREVREEKNMRVKVEEKKLHLHEKFVNQNEKGTMRQKRTGFFTRELWTL